MENKEGLLSYFQNLVKERDDLKAENIKLKRALEDKNKELDLLKVVRNGESHGK